MLSFSPRPSPVSLSPRWRTAPSDNRLFGWEQHLRTRLYQDSISQLPMRAAFTLIVPLIPAVGLLWSIPYLHPAWYWLAWCGGLALFALQVVSWIKQSWEFVWI